MNSWGAEPLSVLYWLSFLSVSSWKQISAYTPSSKRETYLQPVSRDGILASFPAPEKGFWWCPWCKDTVTVSPLLPKITAPRLGAWIWNKMKDSASCCLKSVYEERGFKENHARWQENVQEIRPQNLRPWDIPNSHYDRGLVERFLGFARNLDWAILSLW